MRTRTNRNQLAWAPCGWAMLRVWTEICRKRVCYLPLSACAKDPGERFATLESANRVRSQSSHHQTTAREQVCEEPHTAPGGGGLSCQQPLLEPTQHPPGWDPAQPSPGGAAVGKKTIWLILPVAIRFVQGLSHACLSANGLNSGSVNGSLHQQSSL